MVDRWGEGRYKQPVNHHVVCEAEDEFVDYAIDAYCSGNEFEGCVGRVVEDEVIAVEVCEGSSTDASCHLKIRVQILFLRLIAKQT